MDNADTRYGNRPWMLPDEALSFPNQTQGPNPMLNARVDTERMLDAIANQAPTPERELFSPRFGYSMEAPTITDIVNVDLVWPFPERDTYSTDTQGSYSGTSTPSFGDNTLGRS